MHKRTTKAILTGLATFSFGVGALCTTAEASSLNHEVSLATAKNVASQVALAAKPDQRKVLLKGQTQGSYFWDTGHSGNGDTGAPASGLPMHEGCFASPSWPMGTEGYITYQGKQAKFDICDRGPGAPSRNGVMLDIDGITYAKLTGGEWSEPNVIGGNGQSGNIHVTYYVTKWGNGPGIGAPTPL
jgi:hypothetical protein